MAATLTSAMLNDLHKGNSAISLLAYTSAGVDFSAASALDFKDADKIFTIKDTFAINQAAPTITEVKIDQGDKTIDTDVDKGEFNITGNCPSVASEVLSYFFNEAGAATVKNGTKTYTGKAYFDTPKTVDATVLVESESGKSAIVFAHVRFTAYFVQDDMNTPAHISFTGSILANTKDGGADWAVLKSA